MLAAVAASAIATKTMKKKKKMCEIPSTRCKVEQSSCIYIRELLDASSTSGNEDSSSNEDDSDVEMEDVSLNQRLNESRARGRPITKLKGKNGFLGQYFLFSKIRNSNEIGQNQIQGRAQTLRTTEKSQGMWTEKTWNFIVICASCDYSEPRVARPGGRTAEHRRCIARACNNPGENPWNFNFSLRWPHYCIITTIIVFTERETTSRLLLYYYKYIDESKTILISCRASRVEKFPKFRDTLIYPYDDDTASQIATSARRVNEEIAVV
ncbi:unnamed protein product [Trichogramma brassicae]|uniref:Uncharacterized protein n=1 Tax=Trichogramma brassicae TaxID=86971 RepID=A0A6H5J548_9HYME|nr:unnamed protein product [Trichogramma brassicae]